MELSTINKFHAKEKICLETLIVNWILAWSLLCDCCAKLIEYLKDIILSDHLLPYTSKSRLTSPGNESFPSKRSST
jgi:hypothetical protein